MKDKGYFGIGCLNMKTSMNYGSLFRTAQIFEADFRQACYLLGAEDNGLTKEAISKCQELVYLPGERSLNVAVAGSIVLYDRISKV